MKGSTKKYKDYSEIEKKKEVIKELWKLAKEWATIEKDCPYPIPPESNPTLSTALCEKWNEVIEKWYCLRDHNLVDFDIFYGFLEITKSQK